MNSNSHDSNPIQHQAGSPNGAPPASVQLANGSEAGTKPLFATRKTKNLKAPIDRAVMGAAAALVIALLIFVSLSLPHQTKKTQSKTQANTPTQDETQRSFFPITDSGHPAGGVKHDEVVREEDIQQTATQITPAESTRIPSEKGSLGAVPPFDSQQAGQGPQTQTEPAANSLSTAENARTEKDALSKSSLVYVRAASPTPSSPAPGSLPEVEIAQVLPVGTRLKARLAYAASTALKTRVIAVLEYNYERDGDIVVPAGAQAIGNIEQADRSGHISIRFDSLLLADGTRMPIDAIATDLNSQVLKGNVQGKTTGKSLLARSFSGIGQGATLLFGRGNLDQPLSEQDLLRERVSENIGLASDQEVSQLALNEHIVVSVSAGTPIYVVMQDSSKPAKRTESPIRSPQQTGSPNVQELRELLQLQRELNQSVVTSNQSN